MIAMGLLPDSLLQTEVVSVLAAFVAINTIIYVTLAFAKMLPRVYVTDWISSRARRGESRVIHPDTSG